MKSLKSLCLCVILVGISLATSAQNYPTDPSLQQIITDIKKDPQLRVLMTSYGFNSKDIDAGQYRFAKKAELKDYYDVSWYGRSDYAYKVSLNANYMDERYFTVFLTTPKDAAGVSHKIFFKVMYNRYTPDYFQDTKWNYDLLVLDPNENETYGLPKITDQLRKKMMMEYIETKSAEDPVLKSPNHVANKIVRVDSVFAYSKGVNYLKSTGAGTFMWTLTLRCEYIEDEDSDGGVETTRMGYISFPMEVVYRNGEYVVQSVYYQKEYNDTDAPGWNTMFNAGFGNSKELSDATWLSSLTEVGFDAITGKTIPKEQPVSSKAFLEKRLAIIATALKTLDTGDYEKIRNMLMPVMNPQRATALTESYIALVKNYSDKLCKLSISNTKPTIPYSYSPGDTSGPSIDFRMSISRESARTPELKKAYKAAGMSSAVLKSTMRGEEYGAVENTSYDVNITLILIENNWYIDILADLKNTIVRF